MSIDYNVQIPTAKWIKWKRKRKLTIIGFIFVGTIVGVDYSIVLTTLYLYLKDVVRTAHVEIYYGLIIGIFGLFSAIFGLLAGRWVDKTRKIRNYLNAIFVLQILGSFLYAIPYSVTFPLIGRALVGIGDPFINVCSGEVIRIFTNEEGTRALWWLAFTYSLGFIIGPSVGLLFKGIHFKVGYFQVTYLNFVGIFMGFLLISALIITNFIIYDCSAEIDLKKYLSIHRWTPDEVENMEDEKEKDEEDSKKSVNTEESIESTSLIETNGDKNEMATVPWQHAIKVLLGNIDSFLCLVSTSFFMYCLFATDVFLPLLTVVTLGWDIRALTYIFIIYGVLFFIILMVMSKFCTSTKGVYYCMLWCTACQVCQFAAVFAIGVLRRNVQRDILLVGIFLVNWLFVWCIEQVLLRSMVAKMVPSNIQSFTEAFRAGIARISTIIAALTTPLLMPYLPIWSGTVIVVTVILLIAYLCRWRQLIDPQELHFETAYSKL